MLKKTLISEFFTTVSFKQAFESFAAITYKLPVLRFGNSTELLEQEITSYLDLPKSKIVSFYNGRSAIYHALKLIGVKKTDEVIVNGYNCISVSNAVIQSGAKIVYSDISKSTLSFDLDDLKLKITSKTKVLIVQHTFGKVSDIEQIMKIAKEKNILIIEDCAHSLGSKINKKLTGTFGDFSIFSTGRDKVISSVNGGFLIINNKNYTNKVNKIKKSLVIPSIGLVIKNHMYNLAGYKAYKFYDFFKLGKIVIFLSRKLGLITEILTKEEKECNFREFYYKLPDSLSSLASTQLARLKDLNRHRKLLAEYYSEEISNKNIKILFKNNKGEKNNYFRFPILCKNKKTKEELYNYMRNNNVLLGNSWTGTNIAPVGSSTCRAGYIIGNCPISEDISGRLLTLPNHNLITIDDASKIINLLNNFKK